MTAFLVLAATVSSWIGGYFNMDPARTAWSADALELLPDADYELTAELKADAPAWVYIGVNSWQANHRHYYRRMECRVTTDWRPFVFRFHTPSEKEYPVFTNGTTHVERAVRKDSVGRKVEIRNCRLVRTAIPSGADMPRQPLQAEKPPLAKSPLHLPCGPGNRLVNASFEMGAVGHSVLSETSYRQDAPMPDVRTVDRGAVHGRRALEIDASGISNAVTRYSTSAAYFAVPTDVVFSVWLKADRPCRATLRMGSSWTDWVRGKTHWWDGAKETVRLTTEWRRYEISARLPQENPAVVAHVFFDDGPGVFSVDAVQLERGRRATPFAPAAGVESAFELDDNLFVQRPGEKVRRRARLHRVSYTNGVVSATVDYPFVTDRYGVFSLEGRSGGRPALPATYAVVHPLDKPSGDGFFTGVNGERCPVFVTGKRVVWSGSERFRPADWFRILRLSGTRLYRLHDSGILWCDLNPAEGVYDWETLDTLVEQCRKNDIAPMFVFGTGVLVRRRAPKRNPYPDDWFVCRKSRPGKPSPMGVDTILPDEGDWTNFVRAVATRYRGRIPYYEIMNEPNLTMPDPTDYVRYLKLASQTIRDCDHEAKVVGVCSTGDWSADRGTFLDQVGECGGLAHVDVVSFHPYDAPRDVSAVTASAANARVRQSVDRHRPGLSLFNDELYYLPGSQWKPEDVCMFDFPPWFLTRRLAGDLSDGLWGSTPLAVPQLQDSSDATSGLFYYLHYNHRFTPNGNFVAQNAFAHFLEGAVPVGKWKLRPGVSGHVCRDRHGHEVRVVWAQTEDASTTLDVPAGFNAFDYLGNPLGGHRVRLGEAPVYFRAAEARPKPDVEVETKVPDDAVGIAFDALPSEVTSVSDILIRRVEPDGDQWVTRLRPYHFRGPTHPDGTREAFIPFSDAYYMKWGNGKPEHRSISRIRFGFDDTADQARARRFRYVMREKAACDLSLPCTLPKGDARGRVAVLDLGGGEGAHALQLLRTAGIAARGVSAAELADGRRFSRANADLLVVPTSPRFPVAAKDNFRRFLKAGGALFAFGGYAFDETEGGVCWPSSSEMDVTTPVPDQLNTHYGKAGDTMRVHEEAIGLFDPVFSVTNAASCRTAKGQCLVPEGVPFALPDMTNGYLAAEMHAIVGMGNAVVGKTAARRITVLEAFDRFGRRRGPVLSLAVNYRGPYKGSVWAFTAHPALFKRPDAAADRLFVAVARRLLRGDFLATFAPRYDAYDPGEKAELKIDRLGTDGEVLAFADGKAVAVSGFDVPGGKTLLPLTCELRVDGGTVDRLETALVVRGKSIPAPSFGIDRNYLDIGGRRRFFGGINTTGRVYASDRENPLLWRDEFSLMADYGMPIYRIIHLSAFMREGTTDDARNPAHLVNRPETTARRTDALVMLANAAGVVPFIAFHDWMPVDCGAEDLRRQREWNAWWTARYRGTGAAILWDVQNEPQTPGSYAIEPKDWKDLEARDTDRRRAATYASWVAENAAGAHEGDPAALVTVGNDQDLTASEKQLTTGGLALMNLHSYMCPEVFRGSFKLTDRRFEGKSLSVGEFGSYAAHDGRVYRGDTLATGAALEHYLKICGYAFGLGGSFAAAWAWKDFPEAVFPWGLFHADLTPKPLAGAFRNILFALGGAEILDRPPSVMLVLPDGFRIGGRTRTIHEGLRRAADALIALGVPFSVINEEGLAGLPAAATTLVWPMAVSPKDASFAEIACFVRRGGRLLVTGDFRWSYDRRPDRCGRETELGFASDPSEPADPFGPDSRETRDSANGTVRWVPAAPELKGALETREAYARFFADVARDIVRVRKDGFPGTWTWMSLPLAGGGTALTGVNAPGASGGALYHERRDANGRLTALVCEGSHEGFSAAGGACAFVAEDGRPLSETAALTILPLGATHVILPAASRATKVLTGEFHGAEWVTYETEGHLAGSPRKLVFSDDTRFDMRRVLR